jgi:hypothetical protein
MSACLTSISHRLFLLPLHRFGSDVIEYAAESSQTAMPLLIGIGELGSYLRHLLGRRAQVELMSQGERGQRIVIFIDRHIVLNSRFGVHQSGFRKV